VGGADTGLLTTGVVRSRWPLIVAVAAVSVVVGATSMYLARHWLNDVLAGRMVAAAQHALPVAEPRTDDRVTRQAAARAAAGCGRGA
jgi:membrane-associated phospholipid phosphatase